MGAKLITGKTLENGAAKSETLPRSLKIFNWGVNKTVKGDVIVNDKTVRMLPVEQKRIGREVFPLDFEHNTVDGSPENKKTSEPRPVAGHFSARVVPGDGVYIDNKDWTDVGERNAKNYMDLSPAPYVDDDGVLIGLHSVALTQTGAVYELTFLNCDQASPIYANLLTLSADAAGSAAQIEKAIEDLNTKLLTLAVPGKKEGGHDSPPKGYPTDKSDYADPENYRYPLNNEKHVRAAWSYINMSKNQKGYSSDELATIKARIKKAGKKYGIEFSETMSASDANKPKTLNNTDMDPEVMSAMRKAMNMEDADQNDDAAVLKAFSAAVAGGKLVRKGPLDNAGGNDPACLSASIKTAVDAAIAPIMLSVKAITDAQAAAKATDEQKQRDTIVALATSQSKVIPLTAEQIKTVPVATLSALVDGLPKSNLKTNRSNPATVKTDTNGKVITTPQGGPQLLTLTADGAIAVVNRPAGKTITMLCDGSQRQIGVTGGLDATTQSFQAQFEAASKKAITN
jgi:hypothetical protein